MIDRTSKKMLRYLVRVSDGDSGYVSFNDFYDRYADYSGLSKHRIMACLRYLKETGYIRYMDGQFGFELEHKAYRIFAFKWIAFKKFMLHSVIVPIIVAIITAVITSNIIYHIKVPIAKSSTAPQGLTQSDLP